MNKAPERSPRRDDPLSRERIIDAAIALLDSEGESGLTFRALSERLATGPGAIYGHIANKGDLLAAACNSIVARTVGVGGAVGGGVGVGVGAGAGLGAAGASPQDALRAVALALFDAMDAHPWVGAALTWNAGQLTMVRVLEHMGQQIRALGVPQQRQWAVVSALLNYILGVGGQNAANAQAARLRGAERADMLGAVASAWSQLDPQAHPFVRGVAEQMRVHDDRADFLVGVDLILAGVAADAAP